MKPVSKDTERKRFYNQVLRYAEAHGYEVTIYGHVMKVARAGDTIGMFNSYKSLYGAMLDDNTNRQVAVSIDLRR